jgi:hypothetical protein
LPTARLASLPFVKYCPGLNRKYKDESDRLKYSNYGRKKFNQTDPEVKQTTFEAFSF